jgi:hypothetical protein
MQTQCEAWVLVGKRPIDDSEAADFTLLNLSFIFISESVQTYVRWHDKESFGDIK